MLNGLYNRIQWHDGMLLSSHHFQQLDNYTQYTLETFGKSTNPFFYGVHELNIDASALTIGVIRVLSASGIFKDGYCFSFDAVYDRPIERNLNDYFVLNNRAKIYFAIQKRRIGEGQISGEVARYYSSELKDVSDENTGENSINIPILKPQIVLLTEEEVDERYSSFPIFEAVKSPESGVSCSGFMPPYVQIDEHSKISAMCRDIVQLIRAKLSYYSDRSDNQTKATSDSSLTILRLLVEAVLPLEAIIKVNGVGPFEVYKTLIGAVAKIVSINPLQLIPQLPIYNHDDLNTTFEGLIKYATGILLNLKQKYDVIKFTKDGNLFKIQMKKEWASNEEIYVGIQKKTSSTDDEIIGWIRGAQIASESMLSIIKDKRVLGAERKIMERGEYAMQPSGMIMVAIKVKSSYINGFEKLCLTNNTSMTSPEEVILHVNC